MTDNWLVIGKIVSAQGLKGEVRVQSFSDFPERFEQPGKRWLSPSEDIEPQPVELLSGRNIPGKSSIFVVRLAGIDNRDRAEDLRGSLLMVEEGDRPTLSPDEYHVSDLIDCSVMHQPTGKYLGKVISIIPAGNDLLEVESDSLDAKGKKRTVLIPFVKAIVPIVDLEQKRIEVLPPTGLADDLL